ncbi:MAG TPA: tyrosine-type recombinase/integrase [Nitrospiraceae bacterium]
MQPPTTQHERSSRLAADLAIIGGPFAAALREQGYRFSTIGVYLAVLRRAAGFLAQAGGSLAALRRQAVPGLLRGLLGRRHDRHYYETCSSPLHAWLKFHGRFAKPDRRFPWQSWLSDYAQFLTDVCGVAPVTRTDRVRDACAFMDWQFGKKPTRWSQVKPADLWRYGEWCAGVKRYKPRYINRKLGALRQLLAFVHLRGACPAHLGYAVPKVFNYGQSPASDYLSDEQRQRLLASFDLRTAHGQRDHAMALCMIDLGFRAIEVARLRLSDIDWERQELDVPPAKSSRGRRLPLPPQVARALRTYIDRWRYPSACPQVFAGQRAPINRPLTAKVVGAAMSRAYQRCGFPENWCGTHRLRRTFATRLYARGVDLKQIADLLGHRHVVTTTRYTQTDVTALRVLVQPWPR